MIREGFLDALHLLWNVDGKVMDAAMRSLWISIVAVAAASVFGIAMGLLLGRKRFPGQQTLVVLFRAGMSVPTVLIGLLCFGVFSRSGVLSSFELLYTSRAIVTGEFFLALPIIVTLTHGAIVRLDQRIPETARTLGAGPVQRASTYLREVRLVIALAVLTAFSRCFTELGIAMMVGGNIPGRTQTLTTATAQETSRGEFARGMAMSLILLLIAMAVTVAMSFLNRRHEEGAS